MKKKYGIGIFFLAFFLILGMVQSKEKKLDLFQLSTQIMKPQTILASSDYDLSSDFILETTKKDQEILSLSSKINALLLGSSEEAKKDYESYAKRKKELLTLRYQKEIPKDENGNYDQDSEEYRDDIITGYNLLNVLQTLTERNIDSSLTPITEVFETKQYHVSRNVFQKITLDQESPSNPKEFVRAETNLILYYFFKELDGKEYLYYILAETEENLENSFLGNEKEEYANKISMDHKSDSDLSELYDTSKLEQLSTKEIQKVYNQNSENVVNVNALVGQEITSSAMGFFLSKGVVATSWSFFQASLSTCDEITITDKNLKSYELDGIITANDSIDLVLIKLKEPTKTSVTFAKELPNEEDPVILLSSKTGLNIAPSVGMILTNNSLLKATIATSKKEIGSPLFDKNGFFVGYLQEKTFTSSLSSFYPMTYLKEIKEQLEKEDFANIKAVSYESLKEKWNHRQVEEKKQDHIPEKIWNEYKQIGDIEHTISFSLIKKNYANDIVSLRYLNETNTYFSDNSMTFDTFEQIQPFFDQLESDGYQESFSSQNKKIYGNKNYQIILMKEFNYLIVIMMRNAE